MGPEPQNVVKTTSRLVSAGLLSFSLLLGKKQSFGPLRLTNTLPFSVWAAWTNFVSNSEEKKTPTALLVFFCPGFMGRAPDRQREAAACNVMWTVTGDASHTVYSAAEWLYLSAEIIPKCLCLNSCHVSRCVFTTVDPETGIITRKEPLETLKR